MLDFLKNVFRGAVRSNTMQFNFVTLVASFLEAVGAMDVVQGNADYAAIAAGVMAFFNILLRAKTKKPLTER